MTDKELSLEQLEQATGGLATSLLGGHPLAYTDGIPPAINLPAVDVLSQDAEASAEKAVLPKPFNTKAH